MKVSLTKAKAIGDPVSGTSSGSTYICCAIAETFKMALRNKGNTLSIRVEPSGQGTFPIPKLKQLGFGGSEPETYLSQHFKCNGGPLALCGAYGAIMEQTVYLFSAEEILRSKWEPLLNAGN